MQGQTQVLALRHLNLFAPSDMFEVTARISRVLALFTILCCPAWSQTAIVGVFRYPNAVAVNGKVEINLQRGAAKNNCVTPAHIMRFPPVVRRITNGTLATLNLYATSCLSPAEPYTVRVFDQNNTLLYHTRWTVPNQASVNIVNIDTR